MNPENNAELSDELLEEYDFSKMSNGVPEKYAKQCHEGVKLIMLDPNVVPSGTCCSCPTFRCSVVSINWGNGQGYLI